MTRRSTSASTATWSAIASLGIAVLIAQAAAGAAPMAQTVPSGRRPSTALPIRRVASSERRTASDPVKALYAGYGLGDSGRGFRERDAARVFTRSLFALYKQAVASGNFDFDFFVQGQDFSFVKPAELAVVRQNGPTAQVSAVLVQNDTDRGGKAIVRKDSFLFVVKNDADGWRIDDATHAGKSVRRDWGQMVRQR